MVDPLITTESPWTGSVTEDANFSVNHEWTTARFVAETLIILLSVCLNSAGLSLVYTTHKEKRSVYHILYINISVSNIIACPLTWFLGNVQFFFPEWFHCNLVPDSELYALAALLSRYKVVTGLAVGVHMNIAMLSLGICQYFAVCRPLHSVYLMQRRRAYAMIIIAWAALLICAVVPFIAIYSRASLSASDDVQSIVKSGIKITANTYGCIIIGVYVILITLALLITSSLLEYSRRTYSLARSNSITCDMERLQGEQRACIATAALLASRTIITVPLTLYFIIDLNSDNGKRNMAIFMLSIVPCAKCIFDPFIYGSLMRDVKKTWTRFTGRCCGKYGGYDMDLPTKDIVTVDTSYTTA